MAEIWGAALGAAATVGTAAMNQGSSTTTKDPKFLRTAKEDLVQRGTDLSNREYTKYTGPRIQGPSSNEQSAFDLAAGQSADAREQLGKATTAIDDSLQDYSSENLSKYMNPYIEGVVQPQIREQNRQYDRAKTALGNSKAGAWGGDRSAFAASELEKNQMEGISDITGKGYKEAFDAANANFFNDRKRELAAADAYTRTGGDMQRMNTQDVQNLMATGQVDRLLKQANLDVAYGDFLEARDWDVNNLDTLIQSISGAAGNTTTLKHEPSQLPGAILGAGASLAGLYFGKKSGDPAPSNDNGGTDAAKQYTSTYFGTGG